MQSSKHNAERLARQYPNVHYIFDAGDDFIGSVMFCLRRNRLIRTTTAPDGTVIV